MTDDTHLTPFLRSFILFPLCPTHLRTLFVHFIFSDLPFFFLSSHKLKSERQFPYNFSETSVNDDDDDVEEEDEKNARKTHRYKRCYAAAASLAVALCMCARDRREKDKLKSERTGDQN